MKTAKITIDGVEYIAVFNNRVLSQMEENGIRIEDLQSDKPITGTLKLMAFMLESGRRYAAAHDLGTYPAIDYDTLIDSTDQSDYPRFLETINACVAGDRQVDAVPGKKAEAALHEAQTD